MGTPCACGRITIGHDDTVTMGRVVCSAPGCVDDTDMTLEEALATWETGIPVRVVVPPLARLDAWCHRHLPEWSFRWLCNWYEARVTGRSYGAP